MSRVSTIMVTGGAGFIGSHTCLALLDHGYEVIVVDDYSNSSPLAVERVRRLAERTLTAYRVDIRDRDALDTIFRVHPIDAVVHFAAKKSISESVYLPLSYYDVNVGGTATLLSVMWAHRVHRLVFSSSCSIYGAAEAHPLDENSPPAPTSPYARSKWVCEQMMADACAAVPEFRVVSLRYFNPAGAHPSG
ncbi:MAG: SDR family NAD(P)-dependent oxidoreductase, partial [Nocardioides sp.]